MSMDSDAPEGARTNEEVPLFNGAPIWERGTKSRRGMGRTSRASSFSPTTLATDPALEAGETSGLAAAETGESVYATAPARRTTTRARAGGVPAGAVAGGLAAVAVVAGLGWYLSQPHDNGMAQLTPGSPATSSSQMALNTPPSAAQLPGAAAGATGPAAASATTTSTTPPAAANVATTQTQTQTQTRRLASVTHATARVRPAVHTSTAAESGVNASTTAPMVATPAPSAPAQTTGPAASSGAADVQVTPEASTPAAPAASTPPVETPASPAQ